MGPRWTSVCRAWRSPTTKAPSYVRGDTVTLQADVKNTGDLDYTNGGSLEFYYKNGATTTAIDTVSIPTLNVAPGPVPHGHGHV